MALTEIQKKELELWAFKYLKSRGFCMMSLIHIEAVQNRYEVTNDVAMDILDIHFSDSGYYENVIENIDLIAEQQGYKKSNDDW